MNSGLWTPLGNVRDATRHGHKATRLARLLRAGLPVVTGWVATRGDASGLASALLGLHPTERWILRSSSPREDRPGNSAAGLFHTGVAAANVDDLAAEIEHVLADAGAVLAQPCLELHRWCTLEFRRDGWQLEGRGPGGEVRLSNEDGPWSDIVELGRRAASTIGIEPALLELGATDDQVFVLQIRPAPSRTPHTHAETEARAIEVPGLGLDVHPGDASAEWVADHAHCPTPLCPLLAGIFGRWILGAAPEATSRLHRGIWHDRKRPAGAPVGEAAARALFSDWKQRVDAAEFALPELEALCGSWQDFVPAWLEWQTAYYAMPSGPCRRWASEVVGAELRPGELPETRVARRRNRWSALRARIGSRPGPQAPTAESLGLWVASLEEAEPLRRDLEAELQRCRHLAAIPFDGRGTTFGEDPVLFWREILRATDPASTPSSQEPAPRRRLALDILALAEDDDDVLLKSYALFRRAVFAVAARVGHEPPDELLDLLPDAIEAWLSTGEPPSVETWGRGRGLRAHFAESRDGDRTERLVGIAAAPGRQIGNATVAVSLAGIDAEPDGIAVVRTLLPHDGVHVPRFRAIVCETGDALGHAAVLAREHGVACVVSVRGACASIASGDRILVDGDRGAVERVSAG